MEEQKLLKKKNKAAGNSSALISACTDLASYYISFGQYSKAVKEYKHLAEIYMNESKMLLYAQTNRGIGEAYMGLHEFNTSLKHFKIYHDVAKDECNELEMQRSLAQLGHLYLTWYLETSSEDNKKLLDEAYGYFVKSLKKCESLSESIEKQDMLARLFSNLGLVKENLGDYDTSLSLYRKSIKICLKHDIYEQLYRGYLSMASLFEKQEMYQETIENYNLAIEISKKLSSKRVELICGALLAKAQTLIKIADFQGAKQVLRKAYKFKTPNKVEARTIERQLRVVAAMCKVEDDIITCNDQKQLKHLYEQMGDGACDLKNFVKAIEYYKKMLEAAEKNGVSDKELGECYYSLGETYKDDGNFKEAEVYFEKEYNLCKNNLKDSLNTLCKIADIKEMANDSVEAIKALYERGLDNCKKKHNLKEEKRLLIRYMDFLRRSLHHKEAFKLEQYLDILKEMIGDDDDSASSSSEYESEDSTKIHIGDNIVLSNVTDVSEESDNEVPEQSTAQPSKRRRQSTLKFKKNLNGEWPLHVACIKGNQKMVEYWLEVDHPVNVRDHAGWLPLHEAAVHGHLEIVRLLLDHKASINDRGGSSCNGITPLHDAASNGHLEVVELLLGRGASAVAKTDDGNTPLFELRRWFDRAGDSLSVEQLTLYNALIERLDAALNKAGQKDVEKESHDNSSDTPVCVSTNPNVGRLRRNIFLEDTPEDDLEEEESPPDNYDDNLSQTSDKSASNEYQMVMQTLRHKYPSQKQSSSPIKAVAPKRSALISEEDFVDADNWLEDDVRTTKTTTKKRKTNSGEFLWGRNKSFGNASRSPSKSPAKDRPQTDASQDVFVDEFASCFEDTSNEIRNSALVSNRRRTQATLLDSGFSRQRSGNSLSLRGKASLKRARSFQSDNAAGRSQTRITNYGTQTHHTVVEADSTTISRSPFNATELTQTVATDSMLYVDVEIETRVFRVPVLLSQVPVKTIKWLAEEAAHRYESKEYMKPVLELETANGGVILGDNDLLSLLFPMGSLLAERVMGKVIEWSLPSAMERYRETCANMGVDIDNDISNIVQTLSVTLDISQRGILGNNINPLLKAINNQKSLTEINLSGNFLSVQSMGALCSTITTLPNLQTLNLSCTGLHRAYLSQLASTVSTSGNSLDKLTHLDLSDNILLKTDCLNDLSVITNVLGLNKLNLSNTGLANLSGFQGALCLKCLECLDISYNELSDSDIRRILAWLDATLVRVLNVSRNAGRSVLRQILEVFEHETGVVLEELNLEMCGVIDSDLFELLRLAPNITTINLSYNPDLTAISLRGLLESGNLSYVNVAFCDSIWTYFDPNERGWCVELKANKAGKATFKITGRSVVFCDGLLEMFKKKYDRGLEIERSGDVISVGLGVL